MLVAVGLLLAPTGVASAHSVAKRDQGYIQVALDNRDAFQS